LGACLGLFEEFAQTGTLFYLPLFADLIIQLIGVLVKRFFPTLNAIAGLLSQACNGV